MTRSAYDLLLLAWSGLAVVTFAFLLVRPAPYGRHVRAGFGPTVPHAPAWVVMELVSPAALWGSWAVARSGEAGFELVLLGAWTLHYFNRGIIYPARARWRGRRMPIAIAASAVLFNGINGALNGVAFASGLEVPSAWAFAAGVVLLVGGAAINLHADEILLHLRADGESGYLIPRGGLYRWLSAPNYLGEIVEWVGFAVLAGTPAAWSFALWTAANLVPRARAHHAWYRATFPDYPPARRALVPLLW